MTSTYLSTCNKNEYHYLRGNIKHKEIADIQAQNDSGPGQKTLSSSTGSNVCSTHCRALTGSGIHYASDANVNNGGNNSCDGSTSGGCYAPLLYDAFEEPYIEKSIPSIAAVEDSPNSYMPPPSPAPNSDRYIMGVVSPQTVHAQCVENYTTYYDDDTRQGDNFNIHQHSPPQQHTATPYSSSSTSVSALSAKDTCVSNFTEKYVSSMQQCSTMPTPRFRVPDRVCEVATPKLVILNSPCDIIRGEDIYEATRDEPTVHAVRYVPSTNNLAENTRFLARDTYTYLRSTVHTPVKRYIPTPPNQMSTDITVQPTVSSQITKRGVSEGNSNAASLNRCNGRQTTMQYINTAPNPIRMKCCRDGSTNTTRIQAGNKNVPHLTHSLQHRSFSAGEYSNTSAKLCSRNSSHNANKNGFSCNGMSNTVGSINLKCTALTGRDSSLIIVHDQNLLDNSHKTETNSDSTSFISSTSSLGLRSSPLSLSLCASPDFAVASRNAHSKGFIRSHATASGIYSNTNSLTNDYLTRTPSYEYANMTIVSVTADASNYKTPVTKMERTSSSNNSTGYSSIHTTNSALPATCMHCNTVRRTAGVHQTTQTTDPISPTPLQQTMDGGNNLVQTALGETSFAHRLPTSESHISPHCPVNAVGRGDKYSGNIFSSKTDDSNSSTSTMEQMPQPKQREQIFVTSQKSQKMIIRQSTITEKLEVVGNSLCSQSVSRECHLLQSSPVHSCRQQQQYQHPSQQQQPFPIQILQAQDLQEQQENIQSCSSKIQFSRYVQKEISRFFGVDECTEAEQAVIWQGRQRRLALRRFGTLKNDSDLNSEITNNRDHCERHHRVYCYGAGENRQCYRHYHSSERPDILPSQDTEDGDLRSLEYTTNRNNFLVANFHLGGDVERKASVATMIMSSVTFILSILNKRENSRIHRHWSRRFTSANINDIRNVQNPEKFIEDIAAVQENEIYFDSEEEASHHTNSNRRKDNVNSIVDIKIPQTLTKETGVRQGGTGSAVIGNNGVKIMEHHRQIYISERVHGWRASSVMDTNTNTTTIMSEQAHAALHLQPPTNNGKISVEQSQSNLFSQSASSSDHLNAKNTSASASFKKTTCSNRLSAELISDTLDNSHQPIQRKVRMFSLNDLDDRDDHRPFFTYWINTVQMLVLLLSVICYGIGPMGIGIEKKSGQVLVNSLSLQTVQHTEQRNIWVGPRNYDLVHLGAKFATCMRSDIRVMDVLLQTRRQERETACCIRNDDSGCVQSSQADCSVRGLFPASISTWNKWSTVESGPGGRISGSVCGLDPKYCETPASIAPYEWPDDITKWPICRKMNSFSQRFRYKDHTAEHMVCEVIAHPCCIGVYGECRITTREYCDFVNGYFHEEASLCSQISCLDNVCGMLPFISVEVPDQFYRIFTSLCLHAGVLHLAITITLQHVFLADLERLIGPIRTAILYIGCGLAGNLTSAVLVPYKPEVGPLASLSGVIASFTVLLILIHWKQLCKPHIALCKLVCITAILFGIGTLPWQLNFAGLLAGAFCGIFLTVALVPFVSITEYERKAKIKLIWSCIIFHLFIYSVLYLIFYLVPMELTGLNTGELLNAKINAKSGSDSKGAGGVIVGVEGGRFGYERSHSLSRSDISPRYVINNKSKNAYGDEKKDHYFSMQQPRQYYYHHRYSDIMTVEEHLVKGLLQPQKRYMSPVSTFHYYDFHINLKNNPISSKIKYNHGNTDLKNNNRVITYSNSSNASDKIGGMNKFPKGMKSNCEDVNTNLDRPLRVIGGGNLISNNCSNLKVGTYV
ncbi:inactive rhomboid protein 1 isoform X2 [Eurosta solidaginis]|uniref:inactive rhomboid protein 1 isoform X2 n=1 Tax=Eurosta solidaginis TaxID=178769 RepID=UPI003530AE1F